MIKGEVRSVFVVRVTQHISMEFFRAYAPVLKPTAGTSKIPFRYTFLLVWRMYVPNIYFVLVILQKLFKNCCDQDLEAIMLYLVV